MADATRMCVVTRERHPREALVRLVAAPDGTVVVDYRGKLPGRGVWIQPTAEAFALLARKKAHVEKTLGATVDVDQLREVLGTQVWRGVKDGLSLAAASGLLVGGRDRLEAALFEDRVAAVAFANDAARRTREAIERAADEVPLVTLPLTTSELGTLVGRAPLAAVGVPETRSTRHLLRQLRRFDSLG